MKTQPLAVPRLIERPHLLQTLQNALEIGHALLTAPAGYGKSITLRALMAERPNTHLLTLTVADLDSTVLESRLVPLLQTYDTVLIDDVHLLEGSAEANRWLQQQMHQPSPHVLLAGRQIPFSCDSLVIAGQASHLGKELLAFSPAEARLLIDVVEPDRMDAWYNRVQGWPLALSLLSRLPKLDNPLATAEEQLFSYLAETIFAQLPEPLQQFMQVTAVPLHFNETLATVLWPDDEATNLLSEVKRRNLYLQPANESGWFRYHDLIRQFLLQHHNTQAKHLVAEKTVTWFEQQGNVKMAVEQALDSDLKARAATILGGMQLSQFHGDTSYLTFRRWVMTLDDGALAANPMLLVQLGNVTSMMADYKDEAWVHTRRAIALTEINGDIDTGFLANTNLALLYYKAGDLEMARQTMMPILADSACEGYPRLFGLRIATLILTDLARFSEVAPYFDEAINLAEAMDTQNEPYMNRANRAHLLLIPLGQFELARQELEKVLTHFADKPGWYGQYLVSWCELLAVQGDWERLAQAIADIEIAQREAEAPADYTERWQRYYRTILQIVRGSEQATHTALAAYYELIADSSEDDIYFAWLRIWHWRRQGNWQKAIDLADQILGNTDQSPYCRAWLTLERDIALGMLMITGGVDHFALHIETHNFIGWRARPFLVRLRALLAIVCWHNGDKRWQRHFRAAHRALSLSGYQHLLTQRDPELGGHFWAIAVAEGLHLSQAVEALQQIGQSQPLLLCLKVNRPEVSIRIAPVLGVLGDEEVMPDLVTMLHQEHDEAVRTTLEDALTHLEQQSPPPLMVQLMGNFSLQRGNVKISDEAWPRPIVLRLFYYFALHAGQPLAKDRILEDLWPDTAPKKAANTFRTVYSLLRKVLEPYMPPKAPNRYFMVGNETYTFDPHRQAQVDFRLFVDQVQETLFLSDGHPTPPLPEPFLDVLKAYAPLLPNLPYEDWLLEPREQAQDLYVEGTLYAAQAYLARGKNTAAIEWGQRIRQLAPWHEVAYQTLMRAYARQGQRVLALRTFAEATTALKQELDISPSDLTQHLAERLRNGLTI